MKKAALDESIIDIAKDYSEYVKSLRHDLHKIPELAFEEVMTVAYISTEIHRIIKKSSLDITFKEFKGGIVVDVQISSLFKRVLFRADIDGLPITEDTGLEFSSTHPGKMHACGHDMHTSMLLGAFLAIAEEKIELGHNVRFVWQRAEERKVNGVSGGQMLVDAGVLDEVDEVHALHILPTGENKTFYSRPGPMMANTNQFHFTIKTTGGHVANPSLGSNAIDILIEMQNSAKGYLDRHIQTDEDAILIPSIIRAGNISNIRPSTGDCCFVFRNYLSEKRALEVQKGFEDKMFSIINSYEDSEGSNLQYITGYPVLSNSEESFFKVKNLLEEHAVTTSTIPKLYGGEDFSYYLKKRPGSFWWLGAKGSCNYDLHTPKFNPDEGVMTYGVMFWLLLSI